MLEKRFRAISPQSFVADGTANGIITVANATLFKVKQEVFVNATSLPQLELEVKDIPSINTLVVGPRGGNIRGTFDISQYTVASGANIFSNEQKRPPIDYAEIMRAVYDEEPTVALRNILVDKLGNKIDSNNRLPVDATVTVTGGGLAPADFDDVKIIKNIDGAPIQYQFFLNAVNVGNIDVYYDSFGAAEYKKV